MVGGILEVSDTLEGKLRFVLFLKDGHIKNQIYLRSPMDAFTKIFFVGLKRLGEHVNSFGFLSIMTFKRGCRQYLQNLMFRHLAFNHFN